ncbi:MAG: alkaline phosphatase family protein [Cyclobacteriaceae bacterium]|nr:alkaline phosphatase family protein [Cyclobacteriaceae bacterium]
MKHLIFIILTVAALSLSAQDKPKLVVGIVVDQMRQEYLYRFEKKFGPGGFKRLMSDGFMLKNAHYNYVPTYTGPGHASVYTGTTPAIHGIIANDWFDKTLKKAVNCVGDENQKPVGIEVGNGDVSPWRLLSTTITDELKLATQKRGKVIGLSMKDRGAVLPAGHMADGAYWFDSPSGKFISSTYYKPGLPLWLEKVNSLNLADQYLNREWKTLLPVEQYTESGPDDSPYENRIKGKEEKPVFPYNLRQMRTKSTGYELIVASGFGCDLLTDVVKAALDGEELGKDEITDFLTVSYSSPDYVGHAMGPNSVEIEDTYLRLDRNIQDLLSELDKKVGTGQYIVFLTADHAVSDVPQYLKDNKIPAGLFRESFAEAGINDFLKKYFPDKKIVEKISNDQVFLNQEAFTGDPKSTGVDRLIVTELITQYLMGTDGVANVFTSSSLRSSDYGEKGLKGSVVRGFNPKRSGDIAFVLEPNWLSSSYVTGTTHGSGYTYDTHVPILFYGWGVRKGSSSQLHVITDIAPTLSVLLKIKFPSGCTGQPITEITD